MVKDNTPIAWEGVGDTQLYWYTHPLTTVYKIPTNPRLNHCMHDTSKIIKKVGFREFSV